MAALRNSTVEVLEGKPRPNLIIRAIWYVFGGWHLKGIVVSHGSSVHSDAHSRSPHRRAAPSGAADMLNRPHTSGIRAVQSVILGGLLLLPTPPAVAGSTGVSPRDPGGPSAWLAVSSGLQSQWRASIKGIKGAATIKVYVTGPSSVTFAFTRGFRPSTRYSAAIYDRGCSHRLASVPTVWSAADGSIKTSKAFPFLRAREMARGAALRLVGGSHVYCVKLYGQYFVPWPECQPKLAPSIPWKALAIVYSRTSIEYPDATGATVHFQSEMTPGEAQGLHDALSALPATVHDWSAGLATMDLTVVDATEPLASYSIGGAAAGIPWVSPTDAAPDLTQNAAMGQYDSISVFYKPYDESGAWLPGQWNAGGLAAGASQASRGAYFASMFGAAYSWEDLIIHEWSHQLQSFFNGSGMGASSAKPNGVVRVPNPDDPELYGYASAMTQPWLSALLSGQVGDGLGGYLGVTPTAWATGSPTTWPGHCYPDGRGYGVAPFQ